MAWDYVGHKLHLAWTSDGNRRVLVCSCGAEMVPEAAVRHLARHEQDWRQSLSPAERMAMD